jgi:hypothetical protein
MDDGLGGSYTSIVGNNSAYLMPIFSVSSGISKGFTYRFRYRALNCIGWGPYSNDFYVLAAQVPNAPPAPTLISVSSS